MLIDAANIDKYIMDTIDEFSCKYGFYPNKIRMGYAIKDKLMEIYFYYTSPNNFSNYKIKNSDLGCEYMGIPVEVDEEHPLILEVGYIIRRDMDKY